MEIYGTRRTLHEKSYIKEPKRFFLVINGHRTTTYPRTMRDVSKAYNEFIAQMDADRTIHSIEIVQLVTICTE